MIATFLDENSNYVSLVLAGLGIIPTLTYVIATITVVYAIWL